MTAASGFDAMSKPVPPTRLAAADAAVREMLPAWNTIQRMALVGKVAHHIEEDSPYEAVRYATESGLDLTGTYRLIATLLAAS